MLPDRSQCLPFPSPGPLTDSQKEAMASHCQQTQGCAFRTQGTCQCLVPVPAALAVIVSGESTCPACRRAVCHNTYCKQFMCILNKPPFQPSRVLFRPCLCSAHTVSHDDKALLFIILSCENQKWTLDCKKECLTSIFEMFDIHF